MANLTMEQCATSTTVAVAVVAFLRLFQGDVALMPTSTIIVTFSIIQVFSLVNRWLLPAAKDASQNGTTCTTTSAFSALASLCSNGTAHAVVLGLLTGLSASLMYALGLREALVPGTALMLGALANLGFKALARGCQEGVQEPDAAMDAQFWPKLAEPQAEDTSSASILGELAAWNSDMLLSLPLGFDEADSSIYQPSPHVFDVFDE